MLEFLRQRLRRPPWHGLKPAAFLLRGLLFLGRRYRCPCCGWSVRAFLVKGGVLTASPAGYCPRCNAKARHRRLCLYLDEHRQLLGGAGTVLEVAPWWAVSRRLRRQPGLRHVGVDLVASDSPVSVAGDVAALPFRAGAFGAVVCTHVLEHVPDDRRGLAELYRVLRPGGAAIISVPLRLEQPTQEDPSITDPEARRQLFGELSHVRWYGADFPARLAAAGFEVAMDPAAGVPDAARERHGLREDENLFLCRKPTAGEA